MQPPREATADPTDVTRAWEELARDGGRIVYVVLDGAGGIPFPGTGKTALAAAATPHLDALARASCCGLLEHVGPGITPGSGPGHLSLFGYDPLRYRYGRGIFSALGIGFEIAPGDVAARVNFATLDAEGRITDRRAGRIDSAANRHLCERIRGAVKLDFDGEYFLRTIAEHRAVLVLRGEGLGHEVGDTDPQVEGVPPARAEARDEASRRTARLVDAFADRVREVLRSEPVANGVLMRGFDAYRPPASLVERFRLRGLCLAHYPMYRGMGHLLGMDALDPGAKIEDAVSALEQNFGDGHDLYFLHVKEPDSRGEDRDFAGKVAALERFDRLLPRVRELDPDVLVIVSDHSTPAAMGRHSWHPVPFLLHAEHVRPDAVDRLDEGACLHGGFGLRPGVHLMGLVLANAGRLAKFGA